jgi:hypothetical protein
VAADEAALFSVMGYFTLKTSSVPRNAFPKKYVRRLPQYEFPLILLNRLAANPAAERNTTMVAARV